MQIKEYMAQYIFYNTAETWTGLSEFAALVLSAQPAQGTLYEGWKMAVIQLYSGTEKAT